MAQRTNVDQGRIVQASDATRLSAEADRPRLGSPISNEAYDVVAALHEKLAALEAYRKYANDGDQDMWQRLTEAELPSIALLVDQLERLVREGHFRLSEPGATR
jgi:hypothetical protein